MTKRFAHGWIQEWCNTHGWTDLFVERYYYWAFPPGAVMPQPIPHQALRAIKASKGFSPAERWGYGSALAMSTVTLGLSCWSHCPVPIVLAFAFTALVVAYFEDEDSVLC
ncbi:MAG: hypothetical protein ACO4AI_15550 [Prochlorothrix sp.]|nr:hypothetical protein [Prochlorothrix sp.]